MLCGSSQKIAAAYRRRLPSDTENCLIIKKRPSAPLQKRRQKSQHAPSDPRTLAKTGSSVWSESTARDPLIFHNPPTMFGNAQTLAVCGPTMVDWNRHANPATHCGSAFCWWLMTHWGAPNMNRPISHAVGSAQQSLRRQRALRRSAEWVSGRGMPPEYSGLVAAEHRDAVDDLLKFIKSTMR